MIEPVTVCGGGCGYGCVCMYICGIVSTHVSS